jgi:hypothetical protein
MSIYSAEDPEGRATDTAVWRDGRDDAARDGAARDGEARDVAAAAGPGREPSSMTSGDEAAEPDVIVLGEADVVVLDEEPRDSGSQDREFPRADIAADTGPELSNARAGSTGPAATGTAATGPGPNDPGAPAVAKPTARTEQLQERWLAIQSDFVDDPRRSVASAADLVTEAIDTFVAEIKERDASLRGTWDSSSADTEVLRNALRDYRSFLDRLVAL